MDVDEEIIKPPHGTDTATNENSHDDVGEATSNTERADTEPSRPNSPMDIDEQVIHDPTENDNGEGSSKQFSSYCRTQ